MTLSQRLLDADSRRPQRQRQKLRADLTSTTIIEPSSNPILSTSHSRCRRYHAECSVLDLFYSSELRLSHFAVKRRNV